MKDQRHKRKETYSILVISNLDRKSRQFHITRSTPYLLIFFLLLICAAAGGVFTQFAAKDVQISKLLEQSKKQEQLAESLETEKAALETRNQELIEENTALEQALKLKLNDQKEAKAEPAAEEPDFDSTFPSLYPASSAGVLTSEFSEEHPYISIAANKGSNIVAAGDGRVTAIDSDNDYSHIIEIEYESGYKTRYLYGHDAELEVEENSQVHGGDTLFTITTDGTELDYQVLYEDTPVNPVLVIEAKG